MELLSYEEVCSSLLKKKRPISLLLGNGFSMAYDRDIFSYNALYSFLTAQEDELLNKLFGVIKTKNFELIMRQLDITNALLEAFDSDAELRKKILLASSRLKNALLESVQALHPEHVFKMQEEKITACSKFLRLFLDGGGHIFTTNYDLLLYWVLMRSDIEKRIDGFGLELLNPVEASQGETQEWSNLHWGPNKNSQNIHYLHGALHLFDAGSEVIKEQYDWNGYLLENISKRLDEGDYPIFVTAGNGEDKLEHIRHNRYLSYCYDQLSAIDGSLITFGFNFGKYDAHIIEAINRAAKFNSRVPPKLWSIYIGVYSEEDAEHARSLEKKIHTKVQIFDAKSVNIWGV